jgi:biopolymer transport protein ExbB
MSSMLTDFGDDLRLLIERGGYVMIPLLVLSVVSIALIIERIWFWASTHGRGRLGRLASLNDAFREGDLSAARVLAADDRTPYGTIARRLIERGATDAVAIEAVETVRPRFDRFMVALSTIITAAPLLGILGTVIGIIQSFRLLGTQDVLTDPRDVAGGIAAALLTTALGLIVAIVTLFPYMAFKTQAERALGRMESVIAAAQQGLPERVAGGSGHGSGESAGSAQKLPLPSTLTPVVSKTHAADGATSPEAPSSDSSESIRTIPTPR